MAVKAWDAGSGEIVFDPESYDAASKTRSGKWRAPKLPKPSAQEAHKAFSEILGVSQDKQTGYVTVSIDHQSPVIAAQWVNWLIEDVNQAVKTQDVSEAQKSIEYA